VDRTHLRGITLTELLIGIAVLAVLLTLAVPSFSGLLERRQLVNAAEEVYGQFQYARSEALQRSAIVRTVWRQGADGWCIGVTTKDACDCEEATPGHEDACTLTVANSPVLKRVRSDGFRNIAAGAGASFTIAFDSIRGGASSAGTVVLATASDEVRIFVTETGHVRSCSPSRIGGYPQC
jgi:type IV fimbrial biogenesis protein FimT